MKAIGHYKPEKQEDGSQANLILGQEWDIPELVISLQEFCIESGNIPLWIDQLCIAQQDQDEVRLTLTRIPDIFRTLDVVALIAGGIWECKVKGTGITIAIRHGDRRTHLTTHLCQQSGYLFMVHPTIDPTRVDVCTAHPASVDK